MEDTAPSRAQRGAHCFLSVKQIVKVSRLLLGENFSARRARLPDDSGRSHLMSAQLGFCAG